MKYVGVILIFILAHSVYSLLNFHPWHLLQPFLIALIFLYFVIDNTWLHYAFALVAGLTMDSFGAAFGLYTISFLTIVFLLRGLQLSIFSSKNTGTIISLALIACLSFWLIIGLVYFIFSWSLYNLALSDFLAIIGFSLINALLVIFLYVLYFNLWLKRHEGRSF
jgi:hypothetical protein